MPTLREPSTGRLVETSDPDYLRYYLGEGWVEYVTDEAADLVADEPPGEFDPTSHNVDEVRTYLAGVDEAEAQRVLDTERASDRPRVTLLGDD
jgi:hypothetical protein